MRNIKVVALIALTYAASACVKFKPLPGSDKDLDVDTEQGSNSGNALPAPAAPSPAGTMASPTPGGGPTLTLYGDSFASDQMAKTEMNGNLPADVASFLSADLLSWILTNGKQIPDANSVIAHYGGAGLSSAITGKASWSLVSKLNKNKTYETITITSPKMLTAGIANGQVSMGAPSTEIVAVQLGTDDFCLGTSEADFASNFGRALVRIADTHPNATILVFPVFDLKNAWSTTDSHQVTGFAGRQPTCGEMRKVLAACPALSLESPRSLDAIDSFNASMAQNTNSLSKTGRRAAFVNWNMKGSLAIDCAHPSEATLKQMAESAWPSVQKLTNSF
jgi:hypothetical protein